MEILVSIGHDDVFANDIERMGFIAAAVEITLRENISSEPDVTLIGIIRDPHSGNTELLKFTVGQGGDKVVLPSYMTYLGKMKNEI